MPDKQAVLFMEAVYRRTDKQIRDLLAAQRLEPGGVEIDTINVIIGDGATEIVPGITAALRVDFRARLTGAFLQEFDGTTGSIAVAIEKATGASTPSWTTISGDLAITDDRFFGDQDLMASWSETYIERGDYLRFTVLSASSIMRVHVGLRIRRLEP